MSEEQRPPERFFVRPRVTIIDTFRAFREVIAKQFAREGKSLHPAWFEDSPEQRPELYADQPHLLPPQDPTDEPPAVDRDD